MNNGVPTFGLWYDFRQKVPFEQNYADFYAECLEEIEEGERLGFSDLWVSEHHFVDDGYLPSPLVALGAVAARTTRMKLGTNVLLLPLYNPLRVAEDAAVADLVSGGRLTLGVGGGYIPHEFETLGSSMKNRPSLMQEGTEVLRRAFEEGRTGYDGKRWSFDDYPFEPRPMRGNIPIYFGGITEPAIDRAARMADGFLLGPGDPGEIYNTLQESLSSHGREGENFPFVASTNVFVDEDSDRAWELLAPAIAYRLNRYAEWATPKGEELPEPMRPEDLSRDEVAAAGTPEEVADRLVRLHGEAPYDQLCFWGRPPGVTHEQALGSMRLFAEEVEPRVRAALGAR